MAEYQAVLMVEQNRRIRKTTQPVFGEWLRNMTIGRAWFAFRDYFTAYDQFKNRFGFKVRLGLVLDSLHALPLNPYAQKNKTEIERLTGLSKRLVDSFEITEDKAEKESQENVKAWGMSLAICGLVFIVIVLALLVASGKIGGAA